MFDGVVVSAGRARRRHKGDAGYRAHVPGGTTGLRPPAVGRGAGLLRRDPGRRLQREPVHQLARRHHKPGMAEEHRRRQIGRLRSDFYGASAADGPTAPGRPACRAENCTEQMGVPGPWYDRIPHFRLGVHPQRGRRTADRVLRPEAQCRRSTARAARNADTDRAAAVDLRDPHDRRRRPVAEHRPRVATGWRCTSPGSHASQRSRPILPTIEDVLSHLRRPAALGQGLPRRPVAGRPLSAADTISSPWRGQLDPDGKFGSPFVNRHLFCAASERAPSTSCQDIPRSDRLTGACGHP